MQFSIAISLVVTLGSMHGNSDNDDVTLLHAIHDAFVSNQSAFPFGATQFRFTQGTTTDVEAARRGELDPQFVAKGVYVFDSINARYECVFPKSDIDRDAQKIGSNEVVSTLTSFRMATNRDLTLYETFTGGSHAIKMDVGYRDFERDFHFPLSLGQIKNKGIENFGKTLHDALTGENQTRLLKIEKDQFEGRQIYKVSLSIDEAIREFWVDLERGAIPLKTVNTISRKTDPTSYQTVLYYDDLRSVPGRGWLPFQQTWSAAWLKRGTQIVIEEANFDRQPDLSSFALEFPDRISLVNSADGIRYAPQNVWNVASLPSSNGFGVEKVVVPTFSADQVPTFPGERRSYFAYYVAVAGFTCLLLVVVIIGQIMRRRDREE